MLKYYLTLFKYSQTWANDHLPLFCGPVFSFYNIKLPLNNDHLSTTTTNLGSRGWALYTGMTVFLFDFAEQKCKCQLHFFYELFVYTNIPRKKLLYHKLEMDQLHKSSKSFYLNPCFSNCPYKSELQIKKDSNLFLKQNVFNFTKVTNY